MQRLHKERLQRLFCTDSTAVADVRQMVYHFQGDIKGNYEIGCELQRKRVECAIMIKAAWCLTDTAVGCYRLQKMAGRRMQTADKK